MSQENDRQLPDGWQWVKLGELIQVAQPGFACGERDVQGVIQLRMNNLDTRGNLIWDDFIRIPATTDQILKYKLATNDVVFNNTNSTELVGNSALFVEQKEPVVYSNHFTKIRTITEKLEPSYLSSWLVHQWQKGTFSNLCNRWIGQSAVKNDKLLDLLIPLPPLSEQKRIAAILNEQMEAVEKARKATEAQLEAAKALPAAYLRAVLRMGNIIEGKINWSDLMYVNLPTDEETKFLLKKGDVLFNRTNSAELVGKTAVFDAEFKAVFASYLIRFKMRYNLADPYYISAYINSRQGRKFIEANMTRAIGQVNISASTMYNMPIPIPPTLEKQKQIASTLTEQMQEVERLKQNLKEQLDTINKLPAVLLRRAFKGEL